MSSHTPTRDHQLITCDACAFRAVETTRGVWITEVGDTRVDHLAVVHTQQAALRAEVERLLTRIRKQHAGRRAIFWELYRVAREEGNEKSITAFGGQRDDGTLTLGQLRGLYKCIMTEHGL